LQGGALEGVIPSNKLYIFKDKFEEGLIYTIGRFEYSRPTKNTEQWTIPPKSILLREQWHFPFHSLGSTLNRMS
jgi:hypothetical protein